MHIINISICHILLRTNDCFVCVFNNGEGFDQLLIAQNCPFLDHPVIVAVTWRTHHRLVGLTFLRC